MSNRLPGLLGFGHDHQMPGSPAQFGTFLYGNSSPSRQCYQGRRPAGLTSSVGPIIFWVTGWREARRRRAAESAGHKKRGVGACRATIILCASVAAGVAPASQVRRGRDELVSVLTLFYSDRVSTDRVQPLSDRFPQRRLNPSLQAPMRVGPEAIRSI